MSHSGLYGVAILVFCFCVLMLLIGTVLALRWLWVASVRGNEQARLLLGGLAATVYLYALIWSSNVLFG